MDKFILEDFQKHLKKVCKNAKLRSYAVEYLHSLSTTFEGRFFTEENFATLVIDGVETQQDIIKDIFSKKKEASAEEVFTYLFKKNVKKFALKKRKKDIQESTNGSYDCERKEISVYENDLDKFQTKIAGIVQSPIFLKGTSKEEIKKIKQENKLRQKKLVEQIKEDEEKAKGDRDDDYHKTTDHELSHIFELQTYKNGEFIMNECSDRIVRAKNHDDVIFGMEATSNLKNQKPTDVKNLQIAGARSISEINNEVFSNIVGGTLELRDDYIGSKGLVSKKHKQGNCGYNINYDISKLLQIALRQKGVSDQDLRFNTKKVINTISGMSVDQNLLEDLKNYTVEQLPMFDKNMFISRGYYKNLENANLYEILTCSLGMAEKAYIDNQLHVDSLGDDRMNGFKQAKVPMQTVLINAIKNEYKAQLQYETIEKDDAFYAQMNEDLKQIDEVMLYPSVDRIYHTESGDEICKSELESYSVKKYASVYAQNSNIQEMSSLVEMVKQELQEDKECMTFIQEQEEKDETLKKIEEKDFNVRQKTDNPEVQIEKLGEYKKLSQQYIEGQR